jgi:transposase InsO family protein
VSTRNDLVGSSNEVKAKIDGIETLALLDTGSTVSTVSRGFYDKHLSQHPIQSLDILLDIECADGQSLPYEGYIDADIEVLGLPASEAVNCLLLVVPDSRYSSTVPLLFGTNIMSHFMKTCQQQYGDRFLQVADLFTPWYLAFRCMVLRDRQLSKTNYRLGIVKCAEQKAIVVPPNSQVVVAGYVTRDVQYPATCALLQPTQQAGIPDDVDISPSLISYEYGKNGLVDVHLSNVTTRTVVIQPRAVLCEVQPVTIENKPPADVSEIDSSKLVNDLKVDYTDLDSNQQAGLQDVISRYAHIFSHSDIDVGHSTAVQHKIELTDNFPFKQRYRRIPPAMFDDVRSHLQQLLSAGIIRPSHSPWSSNVVLAKKKDGSIRMCIDYRQLNQRTVKDSYALPRIEEILDALGGNTYFTVLDMKSGYHQVELEEDHKQRTAFTVGPLGFFEYNRMPFGLVNAPATYQRLMEECLGDLHTTICFIYLDDLIIFSKTYEEHIERLEMIFQRLEKHNLKLSPKKCSFFQRRVKYVGHIVSENGVEADPEKIDKVVNWPTPTTPEEVRKFLGFAGYYRKYVKDFAKITKPLSELMPAPTRTKAGRRKQQVPVEWKWGDEQDKAFTKIKELLSSPPILGYADYSTPFELHTDASQQGLGAVLYQKQDGKLRVISFASRGVSKTERNYSAHKLEFLALKWAISEKFHDYLYGNKFVVLTDNNPLTYILTSAKLDATGHRWLAALSVYDFEIRYRPGRNNTDADSLSRAPCCGTDPGEETALKLPVCTEVTDEDSRVISTECMTALCGSIQTLSYVETLSFSTQVLDDCEDIPGQSLNGFTDREWRQAQSRDLDLRFWIKHVREQRKPTKDQIPASPVHMTMSRTFDHLCLVRGILHREVNIDGEVRLQVVLPSALISRVLTGLHDDIGHPGRDRTISMLRDRFYWPGMSKDAADWVHNCDRCIRRKSPINRRAPLVSITTTQPLELVCMDFLTLETSKGGFSNILVITDHFTRYAQAIPTRNQTARTTAEAFVNHFVNHYGLPKRIHSDQGANFESKIIKELCDITGMTKSRTTPYHPSGNGMCERFNRTLLDMLGTLDPKQKVDWKNHVVPLVHAYNCIRHESTGQSPYLLMFGREPRLPIDLAFGLDFNKHQPRSQYISSLRERLAKSYELATSASRTAKDRQKRGYDTKVRGACVQSGDRVLVRIVAFDGKHKIADRWEEDPYIVLEQPNEDIPVFVVRKENGEGRRRTLHRNLLLPIGALPPDPTPLVAPQTVPKQKKSDVPNIVHNDVVSDLSEDEVADEETVVFWSGGQIDTPPSVNIGLTPSDDTVPQPTGDGPEVEGTEGSDDSGEDAHPSEDVEEEESRDHEEKDEDETADSVSTASVAEEERDADRTADSASIEAEVEDADKTADSTSAESARDEHEEILREPENETETEPEPESRRSGRSTKQPGWMRSGEYTMSAQSARPDWQIRANYLREVASSGLFFGQENRAAEAMISLITGQIIVD